MPAVLERGEVLFFYRPPVGVEEVRSVADVQRSLVILKPAGEHRYRRR